MLSGISDNAASGWRLFGHRIPRGSFSTLALKLLGSSCTAIEALE
jgi:hypothetical protein